MLLPLLFACTRATTPEPAPTPPPAPEPLPVAQPAEPAKPTAPAGSCPDEDAPTAVRSHAFSGGTVLEVDCRFFAYQGSFEYWLIRHGGQPVKLLADVGMSRFEPETLELINFQKARGPGDCGSWFKYRIEEDALVTLEHRYQGCDDVPPVDPEGDLPDPALWPLQ
ncbi:MAG: hypothetical protein ACI8RZ_001502 [Myxococcota bacterium]|jgi:hypothetical protein